jgi:hypothetical protein
MPSLQRSHRFGGPARRWKHLECRRVAGFTDHAFRPNAGDLEDSSKLADGFSAIGRCRSATTRDCFTAAARSATPWQYASELNSQRRSSDSEAAAPSIIVWFMRRGLQSPDVVRALVQRRISGVFEAHATAQGVDGLVVVRFGPFRQSG